MFIEKGKVKMCIIQTYGDTTHTLIDRSQYTGDFLPGYGPPSLKEPNFLYVDILFIPTMDITSSMYSKFSENISFI